MNDVLREWIEKAEGDYFSAFREYRARKHPNYDAACFHAQQCVEKYLKAILQRDNIEFAKTHDLLILLKACLPKYPLWESSRDQMEMLSQFAVESRYPGGCATRDKAKLAVQVMKRQRVVFREALKLPPGED